MRLALLAAITALAAPLALAQSDAASPSVTALDDGGEPNYRFSPTTLTVERGASFAVIGGTNEPHTLTHDVSVNEREFDSGQVSVGQTKTLRAPTHAGSFPFTCLYHPGMKGTLVVAAAGVTPTGDVTPTGLPGPGAALAALALVGGALLLATTRRRRRS